MQQKDLRKGSAVRILNEISIEYDFAVPKYTVKSLVIHQETSDPKESSQTERSR